MHSRPSAINQAGISTEPRNSPNHELFLDLRTPDEEMKGGVEGRSRRNGKFTRDRVYCHQPPGAPSDYLRVSARQAETSMLRAPINAARVVESHSRHYRYRPRPLPTSSPQLFHLRCHAPIVGLAEASPGPLALVASERSCDWERSCD
jgi:hypothetical protein